MTDTTRSRLFDEMAKLMNDAAGAAQGVGREIGNVLRTQGERLAAELDLVRRDDFEIVRALAQRALEENERLAARVAELEKRLGDADAPLSPTI